MDALWMAVAALIGKVAEMGAGFFSLGAMYEPEIPEDTPPVFNLKLKNLTIYSKI